MARPTARTRLNISPQRVKGKLDECEFFLRQMQECRDPQEFGYYLSAFLSAFVTFTRLALVRKHGRGAEQALEQLRRSSRDVELLLRLRNVEVHQDGIRIWIYKPSRPTQIVPRFTSDFWGNLPLRRASKAAVNPRYSSRYGSRYWSEMLVALERTTARPDTRGIAFIFHDSGGDVVRTCTAALGAVRPLANVRG